MGAEVVEGELHGPFQMLVNARLFLVRKRNDFIEKCCVSRLRNIFVDGREEPQGVVSAIGRMTGFLAVGGVIRSVLVSGIVCELDKRQTTAVTHLRGEHKADLFHSHLGGKVDDALYILYGVPVAVTVAQAAVDEGGSARPDKCHEAVVGVPCVDHGIECRAWSIYF